MRQTHREERGLQEHTVRECNEVALFEVLCIAPAPVGVSACGAHTRCHLACRGAARRAHTRRTQTTQRTAAPRTHTGAFAQNTLIGGGSSGPRCRRKLWQIGGEIADGGATRTARVRGMHGGPGLDMNTDPLRVELTMLTMLTWL